MVCAILLSVVTVSAAEIPEECKNVVGAKYFVKYSDRQYQCFTSLGSALTDIKEDETAEIVFLKDTDTWASTGGVVEIDKNVTLN